MSPSAAAEMNKIYQTTLDTPTILLSRMIIVNEKNKK